MERPIHHTSPHMFLLKPRQRSSQNTIRHFIGAMRRHDPRLIEHGKRTAIYSLLLGQALTVSDNDLSDLCRAALLHDLGKLTLPNEVLHENGFSMIGDYLMTECTPQAGADILRPWPGLQEIAKLIALHHERWDGHGQPYGMRGHLIPLGARILSLTDTIDQLLTQKDEPILDQIGILVRILRTLSGTRFDPKLVEVFVNVCVPQLQSMGFLLTHDDGWKSDRRNSPSVQDVIDFPTSLGAHASTTCTDRLNIDPNLIDILELTNPISYDSGQASVER